MKRTLAVFLIIVMLFSMPAIISVSAADASDEGAGTPVNILPTDRVLATQPTLSYADEVTTKYKAGYVLHNMDFSKVTDWASTGYFVTNDTDPVGFEFKDGNLRVKANPTDMVKIMLAGNSIPKKMQDYTFHIKFRFAEPTNSYFVYIQGNTIDPETGKTSAEKNTCLRYSGVVDASEYLEKYKSEWNALVAEYQKGEWVEFTYSAMDRNVCAIIIQCGGHTVKFMKKSNTIAPLDTFMGIGIGRGSVIDIAAVQVVAGYYEDYENLIWPGEENALVQTVTADAIAPKETPEPTPTTPEPTTPETPSDTTGEDTSSDIVPGTKPVTESSKENETKDTATDGETTGCGSVISVAPVCAILLFAFPLVGKVRKKKD